MGPAFAFLTSPPVLAFVAKVLAFAVFFLPGGEEIPDIETVPHLQTERVADVVQEETVWNCWEMVEVPEEERGPVAEFLGVPEAMVIEGAVLCRPEMPEGIPPGSLPEERDSARRRFQSPGGVEDPSGAPSLERGGESGGVRIGR